MGTIVPREVYDKIGMVDEKNFPQYDGDSDFTFRAKKAGFPVMALPELVIFNDTSQTGMRHGDSFFKFYQSLVSIRSNYNFKKDIRFYKRHATSLKAYKVLAKRYGAYIGGFIKWKILGLFGKKRNYEI
jgi:GT2 family glycosyltransferase